MRTIGLNLGSNLGDRREMLSFAVERIGTLLGCRLRVSQIYESEPWGYQSDNPFYNIAAEFESDIALERLLDLLQQVEREAGSLSHRTADGSYADRSLDIDIIYAGSEVVATERLTVPHPRMDRRLFVLKPLQQLSSRWRHPVSGLTVDEMVAALESEADSERKGAVDC